MNDTKKAPNAANGAAGTPPAVDNTAVAPTAKPRATYTRKKPEGTKIEFYLKNQDELKKLQDAADHDSRDVNGMAHHLLRQALKAHGEVAQ